MITCDGFQLFELSMCKNLLFSPLGYLIFQLSVTCSVHMNLLKEIMWVIYTLTLTLVCVKGFSWSCVVMNQHCHDAGMLYTVNAVCVCV